MDPIIRGGLLSLALGLALILAGILLDPLILLDHMED